MNRSRALTWLAVLPLTAPLGLPLVGCGDDGDVETTAVGDGDGDTTGDGDGDTGPEEGDGDPGDGDGDTGPGDGDPDTGPGDGDGDGDSGDGDGDGDSGDGDGDGDGDTSMYSAIAMPGGLDRVVITRVNIDEPSCTRMTIYHPVMFDDFDIMMPAEWRIESVIAWKQGFCPDDNFDPDLFPDAGTGTITFPDTDALGIYPCSINFDIDLDMNQDPPTHRIWDVMNVPVEGVNCG